MRSLTEEEREEVTENREEEEEERREREREKRKRQSARRHGAVGEEALRRERERRRNGEREQHLIMNLNTSADILEAAERRAMNEKQGVGGGGVLGGYEEPRDAVPLLGSFYDDGGQETEHLLQNQDENQSSTGGGGGGDSLLSSESSSGRTKLGFQLVASYGFGHVLNDLSASIWFFYAVLYCQQVLELDEKLTGIIILIGQAVDGMTTPLVGYASDHTKTFLGARKPWHLFGVVCVAMTFPLVFGGCFVGATPSNFLSDLCLLKPWHTTKKTVGIFVACISIFQIGWASSQVSHLALMPDISQSKKQRTTLSSVRYAVTVSCNIVVLLALWILLNTHQEKGDVQSCNMRLKREDQPIFQLLSWAVTAVGILCAGVFYLGIPNHPPCCAERDCECESALASIQNALAKWNFFEDALFWKHGLLYMLSRLMINLNMVYMPLYVQSTMQMHRSCIAIIPLLMYIFSLIGSGVQNKLNHKFGRLVSFMIGGMLQTVGSLSLFILPQRYSALMYVIAPLIGLAGTSMLVTVISMTSDFIGKKTSCSAKVFGLYSFSDKLCSGIAVYIIQAAITCGDCCTNKKCCADFYRDVLGLVPLGAALLSFMIILVWRGMKKKGGMTREESRLLINPTESFADRKTYGTVAS